VVLVVVVVLSSGLVLKLQHLFLLRVGGQWEVSGNGRREGMEGYLEREDLHAAHTHSRGQRHYLAPPSSSSQSASRSQLTLESGPGNNIFGERKCIEEAASIECITAWDQQGPGNRCYFFFTDFQDHDEGMPSGRVCHPRLEYETIDDLMMWWKEIWDPAPHRSYGSILALTVAVDLPRCQCRRYPIILSTILRLMDEVRVAAVSILPVLSSPALSW
jgi:hypothetical protein